MNIEQKNKNDGGYLVDEHFYSSMIKQVPLKRLTSVVTESIEKGCSLYEVLKNRNLLLDTKKDCPKDCKNIDSEYCGILRTDNSTIVSNCFYPNCKKEM